MGDNSEEQLSLFAAASHVSRQALPGTREARQTTAGSGRRLYELYESQLPTGSYLKTCLASLLSTTVWHSSVCNLTWKATVTKSGRLIFRLSELEASTGDTEYGLLPTPDTMQGGGTDRGGDRYGETPSLQGMAAKGLLPTPTRSQYGSGQNGTRGDGTTFLQAGKPSLATMASNGLLPTPTAGDSKASGSRNTDESNAHSGTSLTDWARGDDGRGRLIQGRGIESAAKRYRLGGSLNPRFVEQMMGYPAGWTDCEPSETP